MKKVKSPMSDDLRPEYKRSDLGPMVRGKYARRFRKSTNVVVLDPEVAKAFPNEKNSKRHAAFVAPACQDVGPLDAARSRAR